MRSLFIPIFGIALFGTSPVLARDVLAGPISAKILRVVDGDTLAVRALIWPGHHIDIKVRLADINAPELFRPACEAERALAKDARDLLLHQTGTQVTLRSVHLGKYAGRVIAHVQSDSGEDLSSLLLAAGLAHTRTDRSSWCLPPSPS